MSAPNLTTDQNLLPVQAYFDVNGNFQTFIGQGQPFYATLNPAQSGLNITNSTINSTTIGLVTPSSGVFTNISTTTGTISTTPANPTDLVNKNYVDMFVQGYAIKAECQVASTGNLTLSGLQTIDGYTTLVGDRVLVKNQTMQAQNGIYVAASGAWARSSDANTWNSLISAFTFIQNGSTQANSGWVCTISTGGTLGTTPVTWSQLASAASYFAGTGLTLSSYTFSITPVGTAGTYGSASQVPVFVTNASGQVTSVTNTSISIAPSQINATIPNSGLTNSSITVNGSAISLGGSATITAANPNALTIGTGLSGSSYNGSSAVTIANTGVLSVSGGTTGLTPNTATTGAITLAGTLVVGNGGTGATTLTGYVYGNGTSAFTASTTIPNTAITGLGTMSTQNANSVVITGGTINGTSIGASTRASGDFTTLSANTVTSTTPVLSFNASNTIASFGSTTANSYNQLVIQNLSGTSGASTNYVISNDLGTDSTYYGEFGMNSSVYTGASVPADFFSINNGIYFSAHDGDVTVGSGNGKKLYFAWGTTGQSAHVINSSGAIGLNTNLAAGTGSGTTNFGTAGQPLLSGGSSATPTWGVLGLSGGGTNANLTAVAGGIVYSTATAFAISAAGTSGQFLQSNGTGAPTWATPVSYAAVTDDTTTNATRYPLFANQTSGNLATEYTSSTKLQYNPSTGVLTSTGFSGSGASLTSLTAGNLSGTIPSGVLGNSTVYIGTTAIALNRASASINLTGTSIDGSAGSATTATTATNATNIAITDNTSSSSTYYPTLSVATSGNNPATTSSTKLSFVPSTGTLTSTNHTITGTLSANGSVGSAGQVLTSNGSSPAYWANASGSGLSWQSVQTSNFTATSGNAYPVNTTSNTVTCTLPSSPSAGNFVQLTDYAGTFFANNLIINPNGSKIDGNTVNAYIANTRESIALVYIDTTQGWIPYSGFNTAIPAQTYSATYLVVAGGGSGSDATAGGGGGAGGLLTSTANLSPGSVYTVTVGAGGSVTTNGGGVNGSNSVLSGTGITTVTAVGGGGGGNYGNPTGSAGNSGGSGGGGGFCQITAPSSGGSGTTSQGNSGGQGGTIGEGGGGGAGAAGSNASITGGGNGGVGLQSSITGSAVYYAGGGGGGCEASGTVATTGGSGGGGAGAYRPGSTVGQNGTANTGGGGGGSYNLAHPSAGNGGSGVVILSVPTAYYSGTTTGSPTVTTSGSNTIIKFTSSGSYTA